eukprot:scaffold54882_cov21-Tisochrysis_lutea.AAC.1
MDGRSSLHSMHIAMQALHGDATSVSGRTGCANFPESLATLPHSLKRVVNRYIKMFWENLAFNGMRNK